MKIIIGTTSISGCHDLESRINDGKHDARPKRVHSVYSRPGWELLDGVLHRGTRPHRDVGLLQRIGRWLGGSTAVGSLAGFFVVSPPKKASL